MSTCIVSGFAGKKVYHAYACDGSDLPATDDRGTSQVSGPYESSPTLPATEVTYTIVGRTQCGDDIRRITTKTYSIRGIANQYRVTASLTQIAVNEQDGTYGGSSAWVPVGNSLYGYGSSSALAASNANFNFWLINPIHGWSNGVSRGDKPNFVDATRVDYSGASNVWSNGAQVQLTLYYIDVSEVWTYDLI